VGLHGNGELGDGTGENRGVPALVPGLSDIVAIAAGYFHALALGRDGTVYAWGANWYGQLGDGTTTNALTPIAVSGPGLTWKPPPLSSILLRGSTTSS